MGFRAGINFSAFLVGDILPEQAMGGFPFERSLRVQLGIWHICMVLQERGQKIISKFVIISRTPQGVF